jgi:polyhydroxyalkanoate synthesis regulator phasin
VEASDGGVRDQVQKAIDDLRSAGEKATGDVRSRIDDAVSRLREATEGAGSKAQDQVSSWRETLDGATEDVRKELGKLAVKAQSSVEALDEISKEIDARRKSLGKVERAEEALARLVPLLVLPHLAELLAGQLRQPPVDLAD